MAKILGLLVGFLLLVSGVVNAVLITSSADPALTGSTLIDFDGTPTQNETSFTFGEVTFSTSGGNLRIAPFTEGGTFGGSGQDLSTRLTSSPSSLTIAVNPVLRAYRYPDEFDGFG